jgi:uncharacterized protein YbbC (DUF1343 family)
VLERSVFEPVRTAVELLAEFYRQHPVRFAWREPPYEYEREKPPIDILYGSSRLRMAIESGLGADALTDTWAADEAAFRTQREKYLLY